MFKTLFIPVLEIVSAGIFAQEALLEIPMTFHNLYTTVITVENSIVKYVGLDVTKEIICLKSNGLLVPLVNVELVVSYSPLRNQSWGEIFT
jgi:hypothetical protein